MPINYDVDYPKVLKLCQERGREIERLTFCYKNHLQGIAELQAKVEQLEGALAESCDENRSHVLAEGPWSTDMCPIAGKLSARVAQLEVRYRMRQNHQKAPVIPDGTDYQSVKDMFIGMCTLVAKPLHLRLTKEMSNE